MEARAIAKYVRISPKKARPVADLVRGKSLQQAYDLLTHTQKRATEPIMKTIRSAQANFMDLDPAVQPTEMKVGEIRVDDGTTMKRWQPRAMGRATEIRKRTSHISVVLTNETDDEER